MAEVQHLQSHNRQLFFHSKTSLEDREVFIFRRRGVGGESFPSSLAVLTTSNNASLEISVRYSSPSKARLTIA